MSQLLLEAIGGIRDEYIAECAEVSPLRTNKVPVKRILLVAALMKRILILGVSLLLIAVAFFAFRAPKKDIAYPSFGLEMGLAEQDIRSVLTFDKSLSLRHPSAGTDIAYQTVSHKTQEDYDQDLLALFDMGGATDLGDGSYRKDNKYLKIDARGSFQYTRTLDDALSDTPCTLTDTETAEQARVFLTKRGLLPDTFTRSKPGPYRAHSISAPDSDETQTIYTQCGVTFGRQLDGVDVEGVSKIIVCFDAQGVCEVTSTYSHISNKTVNVDLADYETIQQRTADAALSSLWFDENMAETDISVKSATIIKAEKVYYDDSLSEEQMYIQPCYYLSGMATAETGKTYPFYMLVPALADSEYRALPDT